MITVYRTEQDSMGELQVPADALWGAQTQRAIQNFPISGQAMPPAIEYSILSILLCLAGSLLIYFPDTGRLHEGL